MEAAKKFRERERVEILLGNIRQEAVGEYNLMEVCGGHTAAIHGFGIPALLPPAIRLISGPGCPVCVTARSFIDTAIALSARPDVIIATFGDLMRVPGSNSTLEREKAGGAAVNVVYSINEALGIAGNNKKKNIVFLAIGFETTAPGNAAGIMEAEQDGVENFFILCAHKIMPPAMKAVVEGGTRVNGFLCPGHVSIITGTAIYEFLPRDFGIGCVISGFEPVDILLSVLWLVRQVNTGKPLVEVQYRRAVRPEGNIKAQIIMNQVFSPADAWWRGFGIIAGSGLQLDGKYEKFDALKSFPVEIERNRDDEECICGAILRGKALPVDCPLFGRACTPGNPSGACMVSAEGACNAWYQHVRRSSNH
jgi:hydrogenase expression/formation protein HypD